MSVSGLLWSLKVALVSIGILSIAIAMNSFLVPSVREFATSRLPALRSTVLDWLKPPFLFIILNGIILLLAASAKLFDHDVGLHLLPAPATSSAVPAAESGEEEDMRTEVVEGDYHEKHVVMVEDRSNSGICRDAGSCEVADNQRSPVNVLLTENFVEDNPLVSARFVHGKSVIDNDEGNTGTLRASKSQRYSSPESLTMDSVWRAITSAKGGTNDKSTKKSDTISCRTNHHRVELLELPPVRPRKELSLNELNRQVEDFISKFNEDMRLQREESLSQLHLKGNIVQGHNYDFR